MYIPSVDNTLRYPEIDGGVVSVSICALELEKTGTSVPKVTVKARMSGNPGRALIIEGRSGLVVGAYTRIEIEKNAMLVVCGDGKIALDGEIVFKTAGLGENPTDPQLRLSDERCSEGSTRVYETTGDGMIRGEGPGLLGGTLDLHETVLILGPDNKIHGNVMIQYILVNNGVVDPNGQSGDEDDKTIYQECSPMIGYGQWNVTGGTPGHENRLVINTPVSGEGSVLVGSSGVLDINDHLSVLGSFKVEGSGRFEVARRKLFDARRYGVCSQE